MKIIKKMKMNETKIGLLLLAMLVLFVSSAATIAYYSSKPKALKNEFQPVNITTRIIEEDFEQDKTDPYKFHKNPKVYNSSQIECLVRVRVSESPEGWLEIDYNTKDWTLKEDGYYYYNTALEAEGMTSELFTTVSVKPKYRDVIEEFEVTVYQEAVQTRINAYDGETYSKDPETIWREYENNAIPEKLEEKRE